MSVAARLSALAVLWLLTAHAAAARMQQAPSSRIAIELPDGYEPAQLFSGFTHEALGISVIMVEMPGAAYDSLEAGMTPEGLAAKGVTKARRLKLARAEPHVYMQGEQASAAGVFAKFFVVFREGDVTALITANVQKASLDKGDVKAADIERALETARVVATPAPAKDLFTLGELGPFKSSGTFLGTAKAFTLDGTAAPAPAGSSKPMLIAAPSLDRRLVPNPEAYAEQLIAGLAGALEIKIAGRTAVTYGDLPGIEIEAVARDKDGGGEVVLYQLLLLPKEGGYYRIFGQAPLAEKDRYLIEFRRIAAGFKILK